MVEEPIKWVYVGHCRGCGEVCGLIADEPAKVDRTAMWVAELIRDNMLISRFVAGEHPLMTQCRCGADQQKMDLV